MYLNLINQVIPSTPEDNDPPLVSFKYCKPPRESVCPERCKNDGNWTFFSQAEGRDLPDTEKLLGLSCISKFKIKSNFMYLKLF